MCIGRKRSAVDAENTKEDDETGGLRLIPGASDPLSQSLPTSAPNSFPPPCHVPSSLSLSVPHLTSLLQFYLPPRPPTERSVVGWRLGAMCTLASDLSQASVN